MKKIAALALAVAAVAAVAAPAVSAAGPADKRVAALEKQVKALQAQVKLMRRTVETTQDEFRREAARNRVGDACLALATADLFQSTWTNVDERVGAGPAFGAQQPLSDVACGSNAVGIQRPGLADRPSIAFFTAITGWLIG